MEQLRKLLKDSKSARWIVLILASTMMFSAYLFTDVVSPLKSMIMENSAYGWSNAGWGFFTGAYSFFNVFFLMLLFGGIILDKMGIRFTGITFALIMLVGAFFNYYALTDTFLNGGPLYGFFNSFLTDYSPSVKLAALGFALFGVGAETAGVTVSKVMVKWFQGKELALAMGLQVAIARLGTALALSMAPRIAGAMHNVPRPVLFGIALLAAGLLSFLAYTIMDIKYDKEEQQEKDDALAAGGEPEAEEEKFKIKDVGLLFTNKPFIYIAMLCVLFYSAVFPFLKYASDLMVNKFGVDPATAGDIPSLLPFGTILLTPLFGYFLDKKGKGASIMILGSLLLIVVHLVYAYGPASQTLAIVMMLLLGIAFSLVPAAMWPAVPRIVEERYLGSAYATIFWIQNWGLMGVPWLIGWTLDKVNPGVTEQIRQGVEGAHYDYTTPMLIFSATGVLGLVFAFLLKQTDKKKGLGLELPNIQE